MTATFMNPFAVLSQLAKDWKHLRSDGLLLASTIVLIVALAAVVLSIMAAGTGVLVSLVTGEVVGHPLTDPAWDPMGSLLLAIVALAIIAGGIVDVLQVVVTVAQRKAFDPSNARRVERLGWRLVQLMIVGQVARYLGLSIGGTINGFDVSVGIGGNYLAFALVLFVLARVFRHGNRLETDLEGTV